MFLGRIDEPRKGLPILLAALPRVADAIPDVTLLVAGPGEVAEVEARLDPAIADRVEFLGLVSQQDKARALHSADVYVAPNTGGESFGIILLEAMAAGAPVVASDIEAFQRVLDEGRAGVTFRNEDPDDLAEKLVALLADPDRRDALRAAGRSGRRSSTGPSVARRVIAVYDCGDPGGREGRWPTCPARSGAGWPCAGRPGAAGRRPGL